MSTTGWTTFVRYNSLKQINRTVKLQNGFQKQTFKLLDKEESHKDIKFFTEVI